MPYSAKERTVSVSVFFREATKIVPLCVLPAQQQEWVWCNGVQHARVPLWRTLRSWWRIAALCLAGVTEAHRDQRERVWVVEQIRETPKPLPKMVPRGVIPGGARLVNLGAGRLSDDHDPTLRRELRHWAGPEGKMLDADPALSDVLLEALRNELAISPGAYHVPRPARVALRAPKCTNRESASSQRATVLR